MRALGHGDSGGNPAAEGVAPSCLGALGPVPCRLRACPSRRAKCRSWRSWRRAHAVLWSSGRPGPCRSW
eukprot:7777304-Lingulodinium_polyedra.AAC.1